MKTKFKVGDKVRIVAKLHGHDLKIGSVGTLDVANPKHNWFTIKASRCILGAKEIELVSSLSHNDKIRSYLESGKSITPIEALDMFGCLSLAQRIMNLRDQGMNIKTDMVTTATGKRIGKYSLIKE